MVAVRTKGRSQENIDIRTRLYQLGITQKEFANILGKNYGTLSHQLYSKVGPETKRLWETTLDGIEAARRIKK